MNPELLTIGYEACAIGPVMGALWEAGVTVLIDVRALPLSRKPGFSKRQLAASIEDAGMRYVHLRGLGTPKAGRDAVRHGDVAGMQRIFGAHMESGEAQADLAHAVSLSKGARACLLCFEREHTHCHRAIVAGMIAGQTGLPVRHLKAEAVGSF